MTPETPARTEVGKRSFVAIDAFWWEGRVAVNLGKGLALGVIAATIPATASTLASAATQSARAVCNPSYEYCDPGKLHAGVYTTRYFLPGMRVNVPGSGWTSDQDSTTEFKLSPPGYRDPHTAPRIAFWIDPRVTTPCTDKVLPYKLTTPARAVHWFSTNKNFVVSATKRTTIAGHIPALRIDYDVSSRAPQCPGAPPHAIDYFAFFGGPGPDATDVAPGHTPGIKDGFGTGIDEPVRLYFAHIGSPSHSHLLIVGVDSPNRNDVAGLRADAAKMVAHLHLSTKLPRTGKR
jgi:hypothetical protein